MGEWGKSVDSNYMNYPVTELLAPRRARTNGVLLYLKYIIFYLPIAKSLLASIK